MLGFFVLTAGKIAGNISFGLYLLCVLVSEREFILFIFNFYSIFFLSRIQGIQAEH